MTVALTGALIAPNSGNVDPVVDIDFGADDAGDESLTVMGVITGKTSVSIANTGSGTTAFDNSGTIQSTEGFVLYEGAKSTDSVVNTGTISAQTSLRMYLDAGDDSLTVTGTAEADAVLRSVTDEVRVDLGVNDGAAETVALTHTLISADTQVVIWDRDAGTTDIDMRNSTISAGDRVNLELSDGVGTLDLVNATITGGNYVEIDGRAGDDTYTFDLNSVVSTTVSGDVNITMGEGDGATDTVNNDGLFSAVRDVRINDQGAGKTF